MQLRADASTDLLRQAFVALQQPPAGPDADRGPSSYILTVTFLGFVLTGLGTAPLIQRLARVLPKHSILDEPYRWLCTAVIFMTPLVLSLLYSITVFAPKHVRMIMVMMSFWEVAAVFAVFQLLLGFLGNSRKEQREEFESQEELRLMWVLSPIVCFCCYSCMELRRPHAKDLGFIWICVLQYMVLNPVFVSIDAAELEPRHLFRVLRVISLILLVYSICVLIEATKKTLKARKPHKKFWCIKMVVVLTYALHTHLMNRTFSAESVELAGAWCAFITIPFAYAMAYADFYLRRDIVMGTLEDGSDTNDDSDDAFLTKEDEKLEKAAEG
jgi:MFS family permease